ncbi:radical SAM protein [bacterium]|nr:radical SAM protein [bacterium]
MALIDNTILHDRYDNDLVYALQLEINDTCFQGCDYCYMKAPTVHEGRLDDAILLKVIYEAQEMGVHAIEWLGGEPLFRENALNFMAEARNLGIRNNLWTGGLPLADMETARQCAHLTDNGLISFHLSTLDKEIYEKLHPGRPVSDLDDIIKGVENCLAAGKPPQMMLNSTTFTSLQPVEDLTAAIDFFNAEYGIPSCVNVYQFYEPRSEENRNEVMRFAPDLKSIRKVLNHLYKTSGSVAHGANCVDKYYCSATIAVLNDGRLTPCATIRPKNAPSIFDTGLKDTFFRHRDWLIVKKLKDDANLPEGCSTCKINDECWGCRAKAWDYFQDIYQRDPCCFRNPVNVKK